MGSQSIESIEVDGEDVSIIGEGHLAVQLTAAFDLVIEADGHVFVTDADGDVEVSTPDGHVRLLGDFDHVDVEAEDGHLVVDSAKRGWLRTDGGQVSVGMASDDVAVDVTADKLVLDGPMHCTGGSGRWSAIVGAGRDEMVIECTGRATLVSRHGEVVQPAGEPSHITP